MRASRASTPFQPDETRSTSKREIVDARVALGQQVALDAFEPPDDLVHEPANLGEVARHGLCLVADRFADAGRAASLRARAAAAASDSTCSRARVRSASSAAPSARCSTRSFARSTTPSSMSGKGTVGAG